MKKKTDPFRCPQLTGGSSALRERGRKIPAELLRTSALTTAADRRLSIRGFPFYLLPDGCCLHGDPLHYSFRDRERQRERRTEGEGGREREREGERDKHECFSEVRAAQK